MHLTTITRKAGLWLGRYLPSELLGTAAALLCAWAAAALGGGLVAAALAATWAECVAFYALMLARELRGAPRPSLGRALLALRNLALEFGPAELLDSALIRPAALYAGLALLPHPGLGLLAGKLVADLTFYLPTIISYELLRRGEGPASPNSPPLQPDC